jgi:hypothetical protein
MRERNAHCRADRLHPGRQAGAGGVSQPDDQLDGGVVGKGRRRPGMIAALAGDSGRCRDGKGECAQGGADFACYEFIQGFSNIRCLRKSAGGNAAGGVQDCGTFCTAPGTDAAVKVHIENNRDRAKAKTRFPWLTVISSLFADFGARDGSFQKFVGGRQVVAAVRPEQRAASGSAIQPDSSFVHGVAWQ